MKHLHKASGLVFECGELIDIREDGRSVRKTYDMTIITLWPKDSAGKFRSPAIVDYYFGDYDARTTDVYIDRWLQNVNDSKSVVDAYWITNHEVLEDADREKVERLLTEINYTMEVINNAK